MPGFIGKRLWKELIFVEHKHERYHEISNIFKGILAEYDPGLESMGLDEWNLDVTDYLIQHDMNSPEGRELLVSEMRQRVNEATKLTWSAGVSWNKMLAKIWSDMNKPNGHYILQNDCSVIENFMKEMNIRKIPGIGRIFEGELNGLGISTCREILDNIVDIFLSYSESSTDFLMEAALGVSRNEHEVETEEYVQKSFSVSETFKAIKLKGEFIEIIETLAERLSNKIQDSKWKGRILGLELKDWKFNAKLKSKSLGEYIWTKDDILKFALKILDDIWPYDPVRLLGLFLSDIIKEDKVLKSSNIDKYYKKVSTDDYRENCSSNISKIKVLKEFIKPDNNSLDEANFIKSKSEKKDNTIFLNANINDCQNKKLKRNISNTRRAPKKQWVNSSVSKSKSQSLLNFFQIKPKDKK